MHDASPNVRLRNRKLAAIALFVAGAGLLLLVEKPHPGAFDMPEMPRGDATSRKAAFFGLLRPIVAHHNERIRDERAFLASLEGRQGPAWWQGGRFNELAERYRVDTQELGFEDALLLLKKRVDVIPPALVLVQAAKESGWGRSRFARDGNALFGERCFSEGCGIVPARRATGRRFEVRSFDSLHDAVGSYMDNINSHRSYRELREARAEMRDDGEKLSALRLADHLLQYSERGRAYAVEIRKMIISNGLEKG